MRLSDYPVLSFDCYGTLVDWEAGIAEGLQPLMSRSAGLFCDRDGVLEVFARHESAQEVETPSAPYTEVLRQVHRRIADEWGVEPDDEESNAFAASIGMWPAFTDTRNSLAYLKSQYTLVILSNVDRGSFSSTQERLGVDFDYVFTAEEIGSYKPDLRNFQYMISELDKGGFAQSDILHAAQSLYHDHAPANAVGLASAWINRRAESGGFGATRPPEVTPHYDFHFASLAELATHHRRELNQIT